MSQPDSAGELSKPRKNIFKWVLNFFKPIMLPMLLAIVPTLYHYSNNVEKLILSNLLRMLVFNVLLVIIFYFFIATFNNFQAVRTANVTSVFLVFFNIYGLGYRYLISVDVIRIKHYTFLPLILMLAIYTILPITKLKNSVLVNVWKNLVLIVGVLVIYNIINIVPAEIKRWNSEKTINFLDTQGELSIDKDSPDIYYIIFDEFAGFQAMREYWHYKEVDGFVSFLKDRGFFVAEESHGSSTDTLHQMATRLNYQEYPLGREYFQTYFNDIADNRVMHYLKSQGYTTVVFDETKMGYPSSKSIRADYLYEYGSASIPQSSMKDDRFYFDEFGELVMENTMFYAFSEKYKKNNPLVGQHSNMIYFTVDNIAAKEISSPKFVYVHLLLPHAPFMFNRNGDITDNDHFTNWNYYIDNYIFSIKIAEEMINKILSEASSENPPVIIIQSDHSAQNHLAHQEHREILQNYPEEFKTLIMYALYMPGYDYTNLRQDINPTNTFQVVFNYLFDTNLIPSK